MDSAADARARQDDADAHRGSWRESLRRHERAAVTAANAGKSGRKPFAETLFPFACCPENLRCAIDHLIARGGQAPGPNGRRLHGLDRADRWDLAHELADALTRRVYRPGPHRNEEIRKTKGGSRTLKIQNVEDRVVQRAIVQALQPFLDFGFSASSFGYRPGKGRELALATAKAIAERTGRWSWVLEDIRDAFDQVPQRRLLDIVRMRIPATDILGLIALVTETETGRGLRQGSSLSPILLNVYLDHLLDRPWARAHPAWPLVRVADDLLILCPTTVDAREAREDLELRLRSNGLPLKGTPETALRDLAAGETATWLGYRLERGERGLQARLPDEGTEWQRLEDNLALAHEEPGSPLVAIATVAGWIDSLGPCYPQADPARFHEHVSRIARAYAFEEVPTAAELDARWARAHERWGRTLEGVRRAHDDEEETAAPPAIANGFPGVYERCDGLPGQAPPPPWFATYKDMEEAERKTFQNQETA